MKKQNINRLYINLWHLHLRMLKLKKINVREFQDLDIMPFPCKPPPNRQYLHKNYACFGAKNGNDLTTWDRSVLPLHNKALPFRNTYLTLCEHCKVHKGYGILKLHHISSRIPIDLELIHFKLASCMQCLFRFLNLNIQRTKKYIHLVI